jgi:ATP-dependent RNA helicase RhlE
MGFTVPTPIQLRAFPIILSGKDLIGTAQTGTGKTAAFALPILTLLAEHGAFRCLVLEQTRELAAQVETAFRDYGRFTDVRATVIHGGVGYGKQRDDLKHGMDIVIATPGRLLDHLDQGTLVFAGEVTILVSTKWITCSRHGPCPTCGASWKQFPPIANSPLFRDAPRRNRTSRRMGVARARDR